MPKVPFTKEMKKDYTILIPNMSPIHFNVMKRPFELHGYRIILLENSSHTVIEEGLKYVHNDMCYPALLVIGQMIDALHRGICDPDKCALVITQTGGGCRASNYYFLLLKALERAVYPQIPVISLNLQGMNSNPGFQITASMIVQALSGLIYGDMLMMLSHQTRPYEVNKGDTDRMIAKWTDYIDSCFKQNRHYLGRWLKKNLYAMSDDFASIPMDRTKARVKVGVVGEIYLKYAPLGNNNLEDFLEGEGCEVMVPAMLGFVLYGFSNGIKDAEYYGRGKRYAFLMKHIGLPFLARYEHLLEKAISKNGFVPPATLRELQSYAEGIIDTGCKMGEGWLLTAEMVELIKKGYSNIITTQPFGCLPNHICAKGMIRPLKEKYPESNIVPIDYDPSQSRVNQENRIKLMLSVARERLDEEQRKEAR